MKRILLRLTALIAPIFLTMAMGLIGCGDDHRYNHDRDRAEARHDRAEERHDRAVERHDERR